MIGVLAVLLYANTLTHEMALDDYSVIVTHSHVQNGLEGIPEILTTNYRNGNGGFNDGLYRPLSLILFAIEKEYFDNHTGIAHFINVLLYALSAIFLYLGLLKVFEDNAITVLAICFLFITHPLHTEVVANIKGRDDLLAFFGFSLALWSMMQNIEKKSLKYLSLCLLGYFIALFSKESSVTFALILPLFILFNPKYTYKQALHHVTLFLPFAFGFMLLRNEIVSSMPQAIDPGNFGLLNNPIAAAESSDLRWGSTFALQIKFLTSLILGGKLIHDYSYNLIPLVGMGTPQAVIGFLVFIGLVGLSIYGLIKRQIWGLITAIYGLSIAVASQILMPIGAQFAERLLFMAVLPFSIAIVFASKRLIKGSKKKKHYLLVILFLTCIYAVKSIHRNPDWKNNYSLYSADVEKGSESARVNYNFGSESADLAYASNDFKKKQSLLKDAQEHLSKAIQIYPDYADAYNNLGLVYREMKQYEQGIRTVKEGIRRHPEYNRYYLNIALLYFDAKQFTQALPYFQEYAERKPNSANTYFLMGQASGHLQRFDEAIMHLEKSLSLEPQNTEAMNYLGMAHGMMGQNAQAENVFKKALQLRPNDINLLMNLAVCLQNQGKTAEEKTVLQKVVQLNPNHKAAVQRLQSI